MTTTYWTTRGAVTLGCRHRHRSYEAAATCCDRHNRAVKAGHGGGAYSDRNVYRVTNGQYVLVTNADE